MRLRFTARPVRTAVALAAILTAGPLLAGCGGDKPAQPAAAGPTSAPSGTGAPSVGATAASPASATKAAGDKAAAPLGGGKQLKFPKVRVGDVSLVAQTTGRSAKIYDSATAKSPSRTMKSPLPSGSPLVFLVQERKQDRLRVLLPVRPNGSQGWVSASEVKLLQTDYRITVSTGRHELRVYQAGKVTLKLRVGLGTGTTPTPGGVFYLKELIKPTNPKGSYGPYAYGLSGYSDVLNEFLGGDGEIGIHGTNEPGSIGKSVSHGCIRLANADITKLAKLLPLGVPVQIEA